MNDPSELKWINNNYFWYTADFWWNQELTGIRLRPEESDSMSYSQSMDEALTVGIHYRSIMGVFDSGTSCLTLSYYEYEWVMNRLLEKLTYYETDYYYGWDYLWYCTDIPNLPKIEL